MYQNIATKVLTGEVRLSYAHLTEPYANPKNPGAEPKYSVTMLIPKTDTATKADIDASMKAAYEAAVTNDWKGARPQLRNALIYDGESGNVYNYYYERGKGRVKRRTARAEDVFSHPQAWPEPEIVAYGREERPHDAGNVNVTTFGGCH